MKQLRADPSRMALFLLVFLLFSLSVSCKRQDQKTLIDVLLAACGDYTIFLSSWYANVEDQSQIQIDPIGGYIFLYWTDEDGNACHGEPGVTGQPGPFVIPAYHQVAQSAGIGNDIVTNDQMEDLQVIPFNITGYPAKGMHFVQFDNVLWRMRQDGHAFRDGVSHHFSIPGIVSLDYEFCLAPVYAFGITECASTLMMPLPNIPLPDEPAQHPSMCRNRLMPTSLSMSAEERLNYCVLRLPHGFEITEP